MSESRDAAEGGVHKAANFMMNSYTKPGGTGNPMSNYVTTSSPVTDTSGNVITLSADNGVTSHYPVSGDQSSFNSAAKGSMTANNTTINYSTSAKLLSMHQITPYGQPRRRQFKPGPLLPMGASAACKTPMWKSPRRWNSRLVPFSLMRLSPRTPAVALSLWRRRIDRQLRFQHGLGSVRDDTSLRRQCGNGTGTSPPTATPRRSTAIYPLPAPVWDMHPNNVTAWTDTAAM